MRNLLLFFARYNAFFLFIFLETISLYLLVQKDHQRSIYLHSSSVVSSTFFNMFDGIRDYTKLRSTNTDLAEQIARFKNSNKSSYLEGNPPPFEKEDTILNRKYKYTTAKIINNSVSRNNNYLTLNIGKNQGVKEGTGVVGGEGLIGVVRKTSNNYSAVMSLLHRDTRISAKLKKSNFHGNLVWRGRNPEQMVLEAIPQHADVDKNDLVVTTGFSSIFPQDQLIGIVDTAYLEKGNNFYTIKVLLSCDLSKVEYGFVVENLLQEEQKELEKKLGYE